MIVALEGPAAGLEDVEGVVGVAGFCSIALKSNRFNDLLLSF